MKLEPNFYIVLDPFQELAAAIVQQAIRDYRQALRVLAAVPRDTPAWDEATSQKMECERFFASQWFATLSELNPAEIIRRIKQQERGNGAACTPNMIKMIHGTYAQNHG